ncbi:MAG: site-specific DNA-methyltransferase [Planctomycetaceae bacterium]|nr:site-specific DNA-methyltransferase [Planctomycetaceae bacterium]
MKAKNAMIELLNCDCMEYMKGCSHNEFDLAIVDPPYGINMSKQNTGKGWVVRESKKWDESRPSAEYFERLQIISKNQIIWGGNYMTQHLPPSQGWVFWDKGQRDFTLADGELAYTSFDRALRVFDMSRGAMQAEQGPIQKFHPTQKPIRLYDWLLANYAKEGDRILDTHLGSGSSAIAAHYGGFDFVGMEIDKDYYGAAVKRFNSETAQVDMFGGCDP